MYIYWYVSITCSQDTVHKPATIPSALSKLLQPNVYPSQTLYLLKFSHLEYAKKSIYHLNKWHCFQTLTFYDKLNIFYALLLKWSDELGSLKKCDRI